MQKVYAQRRLRRLWLIPLFVGVLFLVHYTGIARPIENGIVRLLSPIQSLVYRSSLAPTAPEETERRLQDLLVENARLKTLVQEAQLLQEQQKFLEEQSFRSIPAKVVSKSSEDISQTLIVNRGSKHGVKKDSPVIIDQGVLIGTVQEVTDEFSKILLITSIHSRVSTKILNESQSLGILRGEYHLSLIMEFIPQLDAIEIGQSVVTSGGDAHVPGNLFVGSIEDIQQHPESLFQKAVVKSAFDPSTLSIVSLIIP